MTTISIDKIENALTNHTELGNVESWTRCPAPVNRRYGRTAPMFEVVLVGGEALGLATLFEARAFAVALDSAHVNRIRQDEAHAEQQARQALAKAARQAEQKEEEAEVINAVSCEHCGAEQGEKCLTGSPAHTRPHAARKDAATVAHQFSLRAA